MPSLQKVISHQRREYGCSNDATEYPILEQADNVDDIPIHNLAMESYCRTDAVFIEKFGTVEAASRRKILKETQKLVNDSPTDKHLSMYNEKLRKIKLLKFNWKKRQEELHQQGLSEKAAQLLQKESSKNKILRNLKEDGGPFTRTEEIELYVMNWL